VAVAATRRGTRNTNGVRRASKRGWGGGVVETTQRPVRKSRERPRAQGAPSAEGPGQGAHGQALGGFDLRAARARHNAPQALEEDLTGPRIRWVSFVDSTAERRARKPGVDVRTAMGGPPKQPRVPRGPVVKGFPGGGQASAGPSAGGGFNPALTRSGGVASPTKPRTVPLARPGPSRGTLTLRGVQLPFTVAPPACVVHGKLLGFRATRPTTPSWAKTGQN